MTHQAVILAGGKGTRLATRLGGLPKPLVDVDGEQLLSRQLRQLSAAGFSNVILLVSHGEDAIRQFCATLSCNQMKVVVRPDGSAPRGTAGAVFGTSDILADRFLVVYGDTLFDIDLERFWQAHLAAQKRGAEATLFLHPNDHPYDSDLVDIDASGRIVAIHSKPHLPGEFRRNLVNAALYAVERKLILDFPIEEGIVDFGKDLFPRMLSENRWLQGYQTFEYIKDLGTPERLDRVVADLRSGKVKRARLEELQKAVFLDRDGTLNLPAGHIKSPQQLVLMPDAGEAVRMLNKAEFRCVLVTNQPVLARGDCTEAELNRIHAKLETGLGEKGGFLDAIYYCPHHPDAGFPGEVTALKRICDCRKPAPGMLLKARADLGIDFQKSFMIGDSDADISAARAAGVRPILVRTGGATATSLRVPPDAEFATLTDAAHFIVGGEAAWREALKPVVKSVKPGMLLRVAGQSRSGKSTAASVLRWMLIEAGIDTAHVRLDHWTRPAAARDPKGGVCARYDLHSAEEALRPWLAGGALDATLPRYEPSTRTSATEGAQIHLVENGVLIVEGVLGFEIPAGERKVLSLFVSLPERIRRERFTAEYLRRGMGMADIDALYIDRLRDEFGVVETARARAEAELVTPTAIQRRKAA